MRRVLPPAELIPADQVAQITLPDTPLAHRLIDRLRDAQAAQLLQAINE